MGRFKGRKVLMIQGGGEVPFARPMVENPCPPGEHSERIYFPEVDPAEASPLKRIEKMKEAGKDEFEIAAAEHNVRMGHITHGRQISRDATDEEMAAGLPGDHQHVRAVCIKCGKSRELDHAASKRDVTECKNQERSYGSEQLMNNRVLAERGYKVSYKVPAARRTDRKVGKLTETGFDVVFVAFS
ncbi:hypothetical protein [Pyxidicoccus caerfyrddinensis]|jgi:hypothetical protein|uniref:hypothetical protein n=1 Tax=Pyxidicoccus caerfyrddinensis TaxID=2709663 RepID=UPI0013DC6CA0|nr:hypothetical protein [Pyxidicoccus caerfyrddinensis]